MKKIILSLLIASTALTVARAEWLDQYKIVWNTPSTSSADSMPLAGGVLGLNVWVEEGDLFFLMASPNNMDDNGFQTKLGRIRLHFSPAAFARDFRQELDLAKSEMHISGQTETAQPVTVRMWCDAFQPVIHVGIGSAAPVEVVVSYETWANYEAKYLEGGFQWMRRLNPKIDRRARDMKAQGMTAFASAIPDPLRDLTAGGRLVASGLVEAGTGGGTFNKLPLKTWSVKTARPVKDLNLTFALRMEQDKSVAEWESKLAMSARQAALDASKAREKSLAWWKEFWDRSHIIINPGKDATDKAWLAGRNYQLIRYQTAANRDGRAMTLFNGGMFMCTGNPDVRFWQGCQFMAQNQRLIYWPMLKSGDFDLLKVALDIYRDRTEVSRLHAKKFWGVDGVAYPEPFSIFGLDSIGTDAEGRSVPKHLKYHHTSGMEFALMMLELGRYTGQDISAYLDAPLGLIQYYDRFYQKRNKGLDANGKLIIHPSDALEIYHGCTNNTDVVAGLTALTDGLLALPPKYLTAGERAYLTGFKKRIPPFPIKEKDGRKYFAAAESWERVLQNPNMEFPQMYVCFPFNIVALGRPGIELAEATWDLDSVLPNARVQKQNKCWYQSAINLARLGRTQEAAQLTQAKLLHPSARFPTFYYNPGFDQMPDTDHGGAAMIALQEMIMQTFGKRILLGPAWPADWDCDFKLHAPFETIVEGRVTGGKVVVDKVTPAARQADIEVFPLKGPPVGQAKPATASTIYGAGYTPDKAFDGNPKTRWSATVGQATAWLEVDLGAPTEIGRAVIDESSFPQTTKFTIEAQMEDGAWKTVAEGDTIGDHKELKFAPVKAQKFRLHILASKLNNARSGVTVNEFQLFAK